MVLRTFCLATLAFSVLAVVVGWPPRVAAQNYSVTDLGTLGGSFSKAHALNDLGQVVGVAKLSNNFNMRAFLWDQGEITHLGTLGGTDSFAFGINNKTQIVGRSDVGMFWNYVLWPHMGGMADAPVIWPGCGAGRGSGANRQSDAGGRHPARLA